MRAAAIKQILSSPLWAIIEKMLACAAFVFAAFVAVRFCTQAIIGFPGFRQTQTALSVYWMVREGFTFPYITPVAGYPWAIPFEFPIYQWLVAIIVKVIGTPLEPTGRLVSFLFMLGCAWPCFMISKKLKLHPSVFWVFCALFWTTPIYLCCGRTFMIETTSLFFILMSMPYALDLIESKTSTLSAILFAIFACLAVLQKVTTGIPVIICMAFLWFAKTAKERNRQPVDTKDRRYTFLAALFAFCFPIVVAWCWTTYSDAVKSQNLLGAQLASSALRTKEWSFGTLAQKFSLTTYKEIIWTRCMTPETGGWLIGLLLIIPFFIRSAKPAKMFILTALALFLLPVLIFTNLHWMHRYYQTSNMIFLTAAVVFVIAELLPSVLHTRMISVILAIIMMAINITAFTIEYLPYVRKHFNAENHIAIAVGDIIKKNTHPDSAIVVFGNDWNSATAFYSQRKSLTAPLWFSQYDALWEQPEKFIGDLKLGAVVVYESGNKPTAEDIQKRLNSRPDWTLLSQTGKAWVLLKKQQ